MIAGDYGGVFGLERPGRVFRDSGGALGLLVVLLKSSEDFFFFCRDPNVQHKENLGCFTSL